MKPSLTSLKLRVKPSSIHGYGVFADQEIAMGETIEECHALVSQDKVPEFVDYFFNMGGKYAIALGNGSIYNHSNRPNADYEWDIEDHILCITALKAIKKGEEILISYGVNYFSSRGLKIKKESLWLKLRKFHPHIRLLFRFTLVSAALYLFLIGLR